MRRLTLVTGLALVALLVVAAVLSLGWTPHDPTLVQAGQRLQPPSWSHWLGTDRMGIDLVSRLMTGARSTLLVGVAAVLLAAAVGVPLGIWAGMSRGLAADLVLRAGDVLLALPALLLAILLVAARGGSAATVTIAIGVAAIPVFLRLANAATRGVMALDYIDAARMAGISRAAIARRHVLPNIAPLLGVQASASFSVAILAEAGLSYLGLGAPAGSPTWGRMMRDGQADLFLTPWPALIPGLAVALAVLGFNLLGDGLRDQLDPRLREWR
ncbi:MAG: ABC transporter permease [Propionibacteriaceae bacterium]|jgi:peptide/nickel transport system permease protein|nr:ABC transporter permease [Propionibacteriaceae bacterium]